jgi:hypothetical protein
MWLMCHQEQCDAWTPPNDAHLPETTLPDLMDKAQVKVPCLFHSPGSYTDPGPHQTAAGPRCEALDTQRARARGARGAGPQRTGGRRPGGHGRCRRRGLTALQPEGNRHGGRRRGEGWPRRARGQLLLLGRHWVPSARMMMPRWFCPVATVDCHDNRHVSSLASVPVRRLGSVAQRKV